MTSVARIRHKLSLLRASATSAYRAFRAWLFPERYFTKLVKINTIDIPHTSIPTYENFRNYQKVADTVQGQVQEAYYLDFLRHAQSPSVHSGAYKRGEVFTCILDNTKLHVQSGVVVTPENELLVNSAMSPDRMCSTRVFRSRIEDVSVRIDDRCATIMDGQADNYSHWLSECLPRLYSLYRTGEPLRLIAPQNMGKNWREALELCIPENVTLEYCDAEWVGVKEFVFASIPTYTSFALVPVEHGRYIRNRLYKAYGLSEEPTPTKNIYITRRDARKRFVLNEADVISYLEKYNFQVCSLDKLSYRDQVTVFHDAKNIIAPHGAGNTNVILSDYSPKVALLEFINTQPKPHFFFMTRSFGQRYYYMFSGGEAVNSDIFVDMKQFKQRVEQMMDDV